MIKPIIKINNSEIKRLDNELEIIVALNDFIESFSDELSIDAVKEIIIPDDFEKEVIENQMKHGLSVGITNDGGNRAFGKVLCYPVDGSVECIVFLSYEIINLFTHLQTIQIAKIFIKHEFCHCHDYFTRSLEYNIFEYENESTGNIINYLRYNAEIIWEEYIASRLSANKYADFDLLISCISKLTIIEDTKKFIENAKSDFEFPDDEQKFKTMVQLNSSLVLKTCSMIIGYCHGYDYFDAYDCKDAFVLEIWKEIEHELLNLYKLYPQNCSDPCYFNSMGEVVAKLWNYYGMYYSKQFNRFLIND